jgi:hypothetical protein
MCHNYRNPKPTLNLLLFTFQKPHFHPPRKIDHQTWPKSFQTSHLTLYAIFKRRFMEAFSRYHFLVIEIVGFDNFKYIPCSCVPHNNRIFLVYLANAPRHEGVH